MNEEVRRVSSEKPPGRAQAVRRDAGGGAGVAPAPDERSTTRLAMVAPSTPSGPLRRRRRRPLGFASLVGVVPLLATLVLVGAAAFVLLGGAPWVGDSLPVTVVPGLVDRDLPEATSIAEAHGLKVAVANTIVTADRPRGSVIAQDPQPGRRVRKGGGIDVTISAGIRPPDVIGRSLDEARAALVRGGWTVGAVTAAAGAAAAGTVVEMRPGPDEPAASRQQPIGLVVASGDAEPSTPAPSVGALSAGWGDGAAVTVAGDSSDRAGRFTVKVGSSGVSANPTMRLTFSSPRRMTGGVLVQLVATTDGPLVVAGMTRMVLLVGQQPDYVELVFVHTPIVDAAYAFDYIIATP